MMAPVISQYSLTVTLIHKFTWKDKIVKIYLKYQKYSSGRIAQFIAGKGRDNFNDIIRCSDDHMIWI